MFSYRWMVLAVLAMLVTPGLASAQPPATMPPADAPPAGTLTSAQAALRDHLQALDRQLHSRFERVLASLAEGEETASAQARWSGSEMTSHLEGLAVLVRRGDFGAPAPWLERLDVLARKAARIRRAAQIDPDAARRELARLVPSAMAVAPAPRAGTNETCAAALAIGNGLMVGSTAGARADGAFGFCGVSELSPDLWYRFTAPIEGTYYATTAGSSFDTVLSVYRGCPTSAQALVACSDNRDDSLQAGLQFNAEAGEEVFLRLSGFAGAAGSFRLGVGPGATIAGSVRAAGDSQPLPQVRVGLGAIGDTFDAYSAATAADGSFRIVLAEPGRYWARTEPTAGFGRQLWDGVDCTSAGCDLDAATPIEVGATSAVGGIDFLLKRGGQLTGNVRAAAGGAPIVGAQVTVVARGDTPGDEPRQATTDENGEWIMAGLAPGGYVAWVEAAEHLAQVYPSQPCIRIFGRECSTQNAELITVEAEQTRGGIDFALLRGGAIAGKVVAATTGEPLAFVDVRVFDSSRNVVGSAVSDAAGTYEVGGLAPGSYRVTAEPFTGSYLNQLYDRVDCDGSTGLSGCDLQRGRAVTVGEMTVSRGIDFTLEVGGSLEGRVLDAHTGFPIDFVSIEVINAAGDAVERERTRSDGRWAAVGLYPGRYRVVARASEGYFNQVFEGVDCEGAGEPSCESASAATLVELGDGGSSVVDVDFSLAPKGSIAGRIVERSSGAPIEFASVEVLDEGFDILGQTTADAAGFYTLQGLAAGRYRVKVGARGFLTQLYEDVLCVGDPRQPCAETAGTRIDLGRSERREEIDFELRRAGVISGRVRAVRDGQPISDAEVTLYDSHGSLFDPQDTDPEGRFAFRNLVPGRYRATAVASGFLAEIYDDVFCDIEEDECDLSLGTDIQLGLESVVDSLDFDLDSFGVVTGRVVDATTGAGIGGAMVVLLDETGRTLDSFTTTDSSGRYQLQGVRPGGQFLAVVPPLGYLGEVFGGVHCERPLEAGCNVAGATPVSAPLSSMTSGIDFALDPDAEIRARVHGERTGDPIASARIELFDAEGCSLGGHVADQEGRITIGGLLGGRYFARIGPGFSGGFLVELFDDLACLSPGCGVTGGTPIEVAAGGSVTIEVGLSALGEISGTVRRAASGVGVEGANLSFYDEEGQSVTSTSTGADGTYFIGGLEPGRYFLVARRSGLVTQLWSGMACVLSSCDPTLGTVLEIEPDSTLTGVDFALETGGLISGTVRDAFRDELSDSVGIELWSEGRRIGETFADSFGRWVLTGLTEGVYTVSTRSSGGYADQLWAGFPCLEGAPAGCDPADGTPIVLTAPAQVRTGIDFVLVPLEPAECNFRGLCLADGRFQVEVSWRDFAGVGDQAEAEALTDDAGYFWFLDDENVEVVVKVVDACAEPNPGFWFFAAGLTNFEVETTVTDLLTGEVKTYRNPLGQPFRPILDTAAFSACVNGRSAPATERAAVEPRLPKLFESCDEGEHVLCLNDGRFQIEAFFETFLGETGMAHAVPLTGDAGYFWFFDDDNVEVVVKVLDSCFAAEPRFWVFAAGLTNVEVLLRVTDTESGEVKEYRNPLATPFQPILDTGAFATCP